MFFFFARGISGPRVLMLVLGSVKKSLQNQREIFSSWMGLSLKWWHLVLVKHLTFSSLFDDTQTHSVDMKGCP
jgi:hypothetical protein